MKIIDNRINALTLKDLPVGDTFVFKFPETQEPMIVFSKAPECETVCCYSFKTNKLSHYLGSSSVIKISCELIITE